MHAKSDLYEEGYSAWTADQVALLRQGWVQDIDAAHVAEELESMGLRERNELVSRLIILVAHLLKWQYQPEHRASIWRGSIAQQRVQVIRELRLSPSLKPFLGEAVQLAYNDALHIANKETGFPASVFPEGCPFQETKILDEDYWPETFQG